MSAPVWTTGLAFSVGAAAGTAVVVRALHKLPSGVEPSLVDGYLAREGAVFLLLSLGLQAMLRVDTFLLAGFAFPKERIGLYGVASAPVWGLLGVAQLVAVASYPTLAKGATERPAERAARPGDRLRRRGDRRRRSQRRSPSSGSPWSASCSGRSTSARRL